MSAHVQDQPRMPQLRILVPMQPSMLGITESAVLKLLVIEILRSLIHKSTVEKL